MQGCPVRENKPLAWPGIEGWATLCQDQCCEKPSRVLDAGDIRGTMITCRSDGGTELCTFRALDPRQSLNKNELDSGIDADVMLEMAH